MFSPRLGASHDLPRTSRESRDLRCYEYTHAIAFCRNQKKRPGTESERRAGIGHVAVGMTRQGYDLQLTRYEERGLARDLLHDRDGALADERDRHRVGAHAVAADAARGVGGVEEGGARGVRARRSAPRAAPVPRA